MTRCTVLLEPYIVQVHSVDDCWLAVVIKKEKWANDAAGIKSAPNSYFFQITSGCLFVQMRQIANMQRLNGLRNLIPAKSQILPQNSEQTGHTDVQRPRGAWNRRF